MNYYLSIACSDSSCGAGIEQDQKVFQNLQVWGLSAVTGLSIQGFEQVIKVKATDPIFFDECLSYLFSEFQIKGVKIGLIPHPSLIPIISKQIRDFKGYVVLDPVFQSSSGTDFLSSEDIQYLKDNLIPFVKMVCPNKQELEKLCLKEVKTIDEAIIAVKESFDPSISFYLKGGHFKQKDIHEVLITKDQTFHFNFKRKVWNYSHGTGCAFSSALCVYLSQNTDINKAVISAHQYTDSFFEQINQMKFNGQSQ